MTIKFVKDTGVTRSSKTKFNRVRVEQLMKMARAWLDKHKGEICTVGLTEIEKHLGIQMSCANNFAWTFNPSNKHAPFSDLSAKYKIKVGAHYGRTKHKKEEQENYFREMTDSEID